MKKQGLTIFILVLLFSFLSNASAKASIFKLPFHKQRVKVKAAPMEIKDDSTLAAKAVYLELEGDNVEFDQEKNIYTTTGNSVAHIVDQNARLEADKIIYYGSAQEIEAIGSIKITREGSVTNGESFRFNVTSNKYLITEPETKLQGAIITARKIESSADSSVEYTKGEFQFDEPIRVAQGFGSRGQHPHTFYSKSVARKAAKKPLWDDVPKEKKYKVTAEKIVYESEKEIKNLTVYKPRVHFKNFSLPLSPKLVLTINGDENIRSAPLITPTVGTQGALGGFALGPSFNFNLTKYHVVSLSPFGQIGDAAEFGIGGKIGFVGPSTNAEFGYGSLKDRFFGKLYQNIFSEKTKLRLGWNQYFDNGFLGNTLPQIEVGVVDRRAIKVPFTEGGLALRTTANWSKVDPEILPTQFREFQRDAGNPKEFKSSAFKIEEQLSLVTKPIFKLGTEKFNTAFRLRTRNAVRAYTSGDFQGIFTGGPLLDNVIGPLSFEAGYDQGLVQGQSPLLYDQFIQGKQSVWLDGDLKFGEWLTLGGFGSYNLKVEEVVERQIRAKFGPKDFKMLVNWDLLRQRSQFGLNFLFGQPIDFERFVILNSMRNVGGI